MQGLNMDEALSARLQGCRQLFQRLDAGTQEAPLVRLPQGESALLGFQKGQGLHAAGALLSYALLGREDEGILSLMDSLAQSCPERQMRRLCQMAADMLRESDDFSQASLYACLRTVLVFLPESEPSADLPGLVRAGEKKKHQQNTALNARYTWAGGAVIVYFDLPDGVEEARIGDHTYSRAQCRCGICLPPDTKEIRVEFAEEEAVLQPADPWRDISCAAGFRVRRLFLPAKWTPRPLWHRLKPWLRLRGPAGKKLPALKLVTSQGEREQDGLTLTQGTAYLPCPALDPKTDAWVEIHLPGVRYIELK